MFIVRCNVGSCDVFKGVSPGAEAGIAIAIIFSWALLNVAFAVMQILVAAAIGIMM